MLKSNQNDDRRGKQIEFVQIMVVEILNLITGFKVTTDLPIGKMSK